MYKENIELSYTSPLKLKNHITTKTLIGLICFAGAIAAVQQAEAFTVNPGRCTADSLEQHLSEGRNAWVKKCQEPIYDLALSEGEFEVSGIRYERRVYITYGVPQGQGKFIFPGDWKAPTDPNAPCKIPNGYKAIGVCTSGCYSPEQALLFIDGWATLEEAAATKKNELVTLTNSSTLEQPSTQIGHIKNWIFDFKDALQELLEFKMLSGETLVVTTEHPIVDHEGKMREASTFKVGDFLVKADGSLDPVISIVGKTYFGKVYNVNLDSENDLENIVIAQGYLNGSMHFQAGAGVKKLNQVLFRKLNIPTSLIQE